MTRGGRATRRRWQAILLIGLGLLVQMGWWTAVLLTVPEGEYLRFLDFPSFYYAVDAVYNDGISPYAANVIEQYSLELGQEVFPYLYPPSALLALFPLSLFDYNESALAFHFFNAVILALFYYKIYDVFLRDFDSRFWFGFCFVVLIVFDPITATLRYGQINLVAALLILQAWDWLRGGRHSAWAGALIGIAILLKTYPALLLLVLLARRQATALATAILIPAGFALASVLLLGTGLWDEWLYEVAGTAAYAESPLDRISPAIPYNQGFNGVFSRLLGEGPAAKFCALAASAIVVLLSALALWSARAAAKVGYFDIGFAVMTAATILVAPLSWHHHLVFVLPALMCLMNDALARGGTAPRFTRLLAAALLIASALPWRRYLADHDWLAAFPFLASFGLWALLVRVPLSALLTAGGMPQCDNTTESSRPTRQPCGKIGRREASDNGPAA